MAQRPTRQVQPPRGDPERAFGQALHLARKDQGFSQEGLGLEAGFDRTFISLLERGLRSPTVRTVVKLAEVLGVRPSELIRRMEDFLPKKRDSAPRRLPL